MIWNRTCVFYMLFFLMTIILPFQIYGQTWRIPQFTEAEQPIVDDLQQAAWDGDIEELRRISNQSQDPRYVNAVNERSHSLLQSTVRRDDRKTVEALLSLGADVHFYNPADNYNTSLHYSQDPFITQMLIDYGADPNALNADGFSPLLQNIQRILKTEDFSAFNLHSIAQNIHTLLEGGADATIVLPHGRFTALHLLFREPISMPSLETDRHLLYEVTLRIAEDLIDHGANVRAKSAIGDTVLHFAARLNHVAAVELLIARGADKNAVTFYSILTPIDYTWRVQAFNAAEKLLELGALSNRGFTNQLVTLAARNLRNSNAERRYPNIMNLISQREAQMWRCKAESLL